MAIWVKTITFCLCICLFILELINAIGHSIVICRVNNVQHLELVGKLHQYFCVWGRTENQAEELIWLRVTVKTSSFKPQIRVI